MQVYRTSFSTCKGLVPRLYVYLWMQLFFDSCNAVKLYNHLVTCSNNHFWRSIQIVQLGKNLSTLRWDDDSQSENRPEWRSLVRNWRRTMPRRDAFCCFPTALLKNCVSQGLISPRDKLQNLLCTHCKHTALPVWFSSSWGSLELLRTSSSRTSYSCHRHIQLSQCWAV